MFLLVLSLQAQKLTVDKMEVAPMDLSASTQPRNDLNGNPCALVKVQFPTVGVTFEGNVLGDVAFKSGEYWVYMSEGSYMLNVKHPNFYPLMVNFRDYGINKVEGKTTYVLTIGMPQLGNVTIDDGMRYLVLLVTPTNSVVEVDGVLVPLDNDGTARVLLSQGTHSYKVRASGCADEEGTVVIGTEKVTRKISLQSVLAQVSVSCPTSGAQIYVNDQLKGTSPWSGTLTAGNYQFEARLKGHHSVKHSEILAERGNRQINLPALVAITGNLDVNYKPTDAEVWLDGKKLGTSPDIFRNIIIGTHEVELRKDGYFSEKKQVTINEGQIASLTGSMTASATNSGVVISSLQGTAAEIFTVNGVPFKMIRVPGGTFTMGVLSNEQYEEKEVSKTTLECYPAHQVTVDGYMIGETEVTQKLWIAVMGSNPSKQIGDDLPVNNVSWNDCQTFLERLNNITGRQFRLPTEAEWEHAARGGKNERFLYSGSNHKAAVCDRGTLVYKVKSKKPNSLGIYDMTGNILEWCQDYYDEYSNLSEKINPKGPDTGINRISRGGDYSNIYSVFDRNDAKPDLQLDSRGFRLAL